MNNKPIHEIRFGALKASIWENKSAKSTHYSVTVGRIYKDGAEWKRTETFGRDDLLTLAKAADLAHTWIFEHTQKEHGV